jgi:four helix bundle protein
MTTEQFKQRTKAYGLRIIRLVESLPDTFVAQRLGDQLLRAGTSTGANYRAAARAKSRADFISKMGTVEEECDESLFWMEMLIDSRIVPAHKIEALMGEGNEILAITVASIRTARCGRRSSKPTPSIPPFL